MRDGTNAVGNGGDNKSDNDPHNKSDKSDNDPHFHWNWSFPLGYHKPPL